MTTSVLTYSPRSSYYLYKITNTVNDKVYIGVTADPARRWWQHQRDDSACTKLRRAMAKHGVEAFKMEVLCNASEEYILSIEPKVISAYGAVSNGYNIQHGGAKGYGFIPEHHPRDTPTYISGFWFPSQRFGRRVLNIHKKTLQQRLKAGTAGETCISTAPKRFKEAKPVYAKGFWFPTVHVAAACLTMNPKSVHAIYLKERKKNDDLHLDLLTK